MDEQLARREGFAAGTTVVLGDGRGWTLPHTDAGQPDPEYDALLNAVEEAEDRAEGLKAELALTIHLLTRNYTLSPDQLAALLTFEPDDLRIVVLQETVHGLVLDALRCRRRVGHEGVEPPPAPGPLRGSWQRFRSLWPLWTS